MASTLVREICSISAFEIVHSFSNSYICTCSIPGIAFGRATVADLTANGIAYGRQSANLHHCVLLTIM